jgi:predicted nucleotidyltransferase
VWVFGSRAQSASLSNLQSNHLKKFSDLDLAINPKTSIPRSVLIDLQEAFNESNLPIKVDIVDLMNVSSEFQKIIKQNYIVIQPTS